MNGRLAVMTSVDDCLTCAMGTYCPVGSANETNCAPGTYNPERGATSCIKCDVGKYMDLEGNTTCKPCPGAFTATASPAVGASAVEDASTVADVPPASSPAANGGSDASGTVLAEAISGTDASVNVLAEANGG